MSTVEPNNDPDAVHAGSEQPFTTANSPQRPSKRKAWITPTLGAVAALAIGLVGGILIGQNTATPARAFGARPAQGNFRGGPVSANFTAGTVVSVKDGTLVVKTRDGSEKTVATTPSTTVTTTSDASLGDLATGDAVTVIGRAGDDGTIDATAIAEGQSGVRFGGRPGAATPSR
ncbi:hypothetical protein GCM10027052_23340 [Parafrigoribacterium mesophilum]|uniref:hypothetical protein n=1 Tax=Parafrigoribacterium mesophilum TaxID=433646 RepID=UPI0031FC473D